MELARKFELTAQSIRNWVRHTDLDEGKRANGLTTEEREVRGLNASGIT